MDIERTTVSLDLVEDLQFIDAHLSIEQRKRLERECKVLVQKRFWLGLTFSEAQRLKTYDLL